ncbi:SusC/RagA family TonB-linked outer membrane protein [Parasegetibacter sp. NRK P23]|uniref:SusC/RagA family TonB-linked outer membrane protein n=1 Tax=Parasegetibacter sp. NRK P23 TaxID=2942999 RepID=UPI0020438502|nr:SusC/RagA family TonB-linked outer membrane protein [Parasegetibacter sp. NRK P23]MCM5528621.1 SusC/RagA family TonB-linked outer membrane protein [Parasegetibacter sp. NRK P23]
MRLPKLSLLLGIFLLFMANCVFAQEKVVTGTVLDDLGTPLEGVTVRIKKSSRATQTGAEGKFSLRVNSTDVLEFSYVGFQPQEARVGDRSAFSIVLKPAGANLGEVVVTAMDIKRSKRELGFATQTVDGDDVKETQRENFLNSLQGRVAGLTVNPTSGAAGASSSLVLRGFNSLSLSNEPLYVVDGVILDNQSVDEDSKGGASIGIVQRGAGLTSTNNQKNDYINRMADINPNDIESITVLKGPEATALYGSQASSGAIVITTKKGKSNKLAVQYDNSFRLQKITRFPETIDKYENGENGVPSNVWRYFGPEYPEGTVLFDNKNYFFKNGFSQTHNLGLDFGIKKSIFRVSGSFFDQDGMVPNNTYRRNNIRVSNTTKIGKYVDITPTVSYIGSNNRKVIRSTGGFMISLLSWPNTVDIRDYEDESGGKVPVFNANPNADYDNPLFNVYKNKSYDETDRYNASVGININPYPWLSVSGRFGYETYNTYGYLQYHPQSYYISASVNGIQDNWWRKYKGYNHTITATAKKKFNKNFSGRLMVGTMWQDYETSMYAVTGNNLTDPNRTDSSNTAPNTRDRLLRNKIGEYNLSQLRQIAYFGEAMLSYKDLVYLTASQRFEQASTLPSQNRNYNYPGASLSVILSDIVPGMSAGKVDFVKLRGSLAGTARLNLPYSTQSIFADVSSSGGGYQYGFTNNNPNLEPERQSTFEVGTEVRMFNSRLTFDLAYYNTLTKSQIIESFRLSYGTGYVLNTQNAGSTRNQGVEAVIGIDVVKKNDFSYRTQFNMNRMWGRVIEMPANVLEYYIADTWVYNNTRGGISLNSPTTSITSANYLTNAKGDILIDPATGLPLVNTVYSVVGDRNPDIRLGWNNQFRYKNWSFNFLWDLKLGGDIFNGTAKYLTAIGRHPITEDRYTPRIVEGVLRDGLEETANPTKNTIQIIPGYNFNYYGANMPDALFIEKDVNWFRLRDVTLSYTVPESITGKIKGIKNLGIFCTANDLVLITNYTGADPSVSGNSAGTRGVGSFGFDYSTVAAPVSINFGLRASF